MRILFYADNFYPEIAGISDSIIALGQELKRRGHAVAFVVPKYAQSDYAFIGKEVGDPHELEGFEIFRMPSLSFAGSASGVARFVLPFGFSLAFARRFKPDVIHTQDPFGAGIEAYFAARLFGVRLVGTNHTRIDEFIKIYGPIRKPWAMGLANRLFAFYYNRCVAVTAPADALLEEMKAYGLRAPSTVVPNPVSLRTFSPANPEQKLSIRAELGLSGKVLIFSGRLAVEKKIDVLLRALALVIKKDPSVKLVIAGKGPIGAELAAFVEKEGLSPHVVFTGFLDRATLAKWYRASDAFAIMCPIETQCLALMQAFATALPSVGVNAGSVGEHIQPARGITVPDGDHAALAVAIEKVLSDPELAKAMGEDAYKYVARFSEEAIAKKWENIYEKN